MLRDFHPQSLNNPAFAYVFNRGLTLTGTINPIELEQVVKQAQAMPPPVENPNVGQVEPLPANNQMNPNVK